MKILKYSFCVAVLLITSCNMDIYNIHKKKWRYVINESPKSVFVVYATAPPIFTDTFPENKTELDIDYSSFIKYGKYKWMKIPVKMTDYKYNKSQLDYINNLLPNSKDSLNYFDMSRFQYIICPYAKESAKKRIIDLYEKKQLFYIIEPKLMFDSNKQSYKTWLLTSLILTENIKYSSQLSPYPYKLR